MNRNNFLLFVAACALPFAVFFGVRMTNEKLARIPEKRLWMQTLDTTGGLKTPGGRVGYPTTNRGTATLACEKFVVRFEKQSFMGDGVVTGFIGGDYQVDGRYGGLFPPDSDPFQIKEGSGVAYAYSSGTRTLNITFLTHRLAYRHFENTLQVNGQKYATSPEPLALSIAPDGRVRRFALPKNVTKSQLLKSYHVRDIAP